MIEWKYDKHKHGGFEPGATGGDVYLAWDGRQVARIRFVASEPKATKNLVCRLAFG